MDRAHARVIKQSDAAAHPQASRRKGGPVGTDRIRDTPELLAREKSLDRQIRAFHWVRLLTEVGGRSAGTAGEREAAARVDAWLEEIGFDERERLSVETPAPRSASLALTLGLGLVGVLVGGWLGAAFGSVAWLSFVREERQAGIGLARFLPTVWGETVVARQGAERPRVRIVLTANLDAPRAGRVFQHRLARGFEARRRRAWNPLAWCEAGLIASFGLTLAGLLGAEGAIASASWVVVAGALAVASAIVLDWAVASPTPGANDNASGVAALLTCAEQLQAQLHDDTELFVAATSGGHARHAGMRALLAAHPEWRTERTLFVHFDRLGGGRLHYLRSERGRVETHYPPRLREIARRLAEGGAFAEITAIDFSGDTDGRVPADDHLHTLTLVALDDHGAPVADHAANDVADALDLATVVRAADFAAAVVVASWRGESDPLAVV